MHDRVPKKVVIDPGHGGKDPGAIVGELRESDLNLQISFKLQELLEKEGAVVYLTRYDDYDLSSNNVTLRKRSGCEALNVQRASLP